jgi:predicted nucleic-acid-binding Zn-ribbon protein
MLMKKFCPNCGSDNIELVAGGITGGSMCADCGYTGLFPEKPLIIKEGDDDSDEDDFDDEVVSKTKKSKTKAKPKMRRKK